MRLNLQAAGLATPGPNTKQSITFFLHVHRTVDTTTFQKVPKYPKLLKWHERRHHVSHRDKHENRHGRHINRHHDRHKITHNRHPDSVCAKELNSLNKIIGREFQIKDSVETWLRVYCN